ncbi:MAG: D-2-hydroxyacid dehydrogenase [Saprospiraceae bacterium]|nr:D-2-hydroxyacid dehydrogenase [Saprospiraceae bacterium]
MNVVILDGYTVNPGDLDWEPIEGKGEVSIYDRTDDSDIIPRGKSADVLLVNKVKIKAHHMDAMPNLQAICLLATGFDNVDVQAAKDRNIRVYNAVGYGTESVAQHTLSMMLSFTNKVESHHRSVQIGHWSQQDDFSYSLHTVHELKGKAIGIIGYGKIGQRVGELARAFGMNVLVIKRDSAAPGAEQVEKEDLFRNSHFISLHAPLNEETREIINRDSLRLMRPEAVIVNTGRGGLINETDLLEALRNEQISGAVLDVLSVEPPSATNPLLHARNVLITPHMAWRSLEARKELIAIVAKNIENLSENNDENRVV